MASFMHTITSFGRLILMRQDTAPQLAILFDGTRAYAVYTCQQSQFLADWQHQQVNQTAHPLFPRSLALCKGGSHVATTPAANPSTVEPLNKGHLGANRVLSLVERLSLSRR